MAKDSKLRVALLVNGVPPYRVPVFRRLAEAFELGVFHAGRDRTWTKTGDLAAQLGAASVKRLRTLSLVRRQQRHGQQGVYDVGQIHITPGFLWELWRFAPEAVISNEMGFRTLCALVYGSIAQVPVWVWWGGTLHTERHKGAIRRLVRRVLARWVKHWISYGETSTEYLCSLGIARERIVQIQNCVDEARYRQPVAPALAIQPRPVLLHVGQLIQRKGIEPFLQASAQLQEEGHVFSIVLVGGGPEKQNLERMVGELRLRNVHLLPPQSPATMPAIYRSADCLVFPTLEDVWGLVANEALWSGLPLICSKFAGCARELVPDENVFDPLDLPGFVEILRRAVTGQLAPANSSPLKTSAAVAETIVADVHQATGSRPKCELD